MGFRDPQFYDDLLGHKDALSPLLVDYLSYIEILFILALDKQIKNTYIHAFGIDIQITFVTLNGVTDLQFYDDLLGHKDALRPLLVDYLSYIEILFSLALDKQIKNTHIYTCV